jgi:Zn-dependent protease with chaperone function
MGLAAYLPLLLPALLGWLARPLSDRLHPRHATLMLTGAAAVLAACAVIALALLVASAVVRLPAVASLAHISLAITGSDTAYGISVAMLAGILLTAAAVATTACSIRWYRGLTDCYREARRLPGHAQAVVTGDQFASAYALPGRPGRIVMTAGMLEALDDTGRAVLLAHERAHLARFHHRYTAAVRLAAAANPMLRPAAQAVEYTVERWADEEAAAVIGDRRLVAQAIGRAARAATPRRPAAAMVGVLGAVFLAGHPNAPTAGPIPRRVAAMLAPAPQHRLVLLAVVLALTLLASACAIEAANDLQDLLALASSY